VKYSARRTAKISGPLQHQLNMYALAATAAGVGVLALTPSAEAKIVYTSTNQAIRNRAAAEIDLNHDGIGDFKIQAYSIRYHTASGNSISKEWLYTTAPQASNAVVENASSFAAALPAGKLIGPGERLGSRQFTFMAFGRFGAVNTSKGPWRHQFKPAYLGLKFTVKGKIHYGWARLSHSYCAGATLLGYAYETIPNKPIIAGAGRKEEAVSAEEHNPTNPGALQSSVGRNAVAERAALGALAMGAPALSIWRRKESALA
jgi:hypothetical protein